MGMWVKRESGSMVLWVLFNSCGRRTACVFLVARLRWSFSNSACLLGVVGGLSFLGWLVSFSVLVWPGGGGFGCLRERWKPDIKVG